MKLLTLEGKGIFNSKGTKHAIEKIYALFGFGENEVKFKERYYERENSTYCVGIGDSCMRQG